MSENGKSWSVLFSSTFAFFICVAVWTLYSVLIAFLVTSELYSWSEAEIGWLLAVPILTGALSRIPLGILVDRISARFLFSLVMLFSAISLVYLSRAETYSDFILAGLGFGVAGGTFAIGVAYIFLWFPYEKRGLAFGTFVLGGTGVALTTMLAPYLLNIVTENGAFIEGWRRLPILYAFALLVTTLLFLLFTFPKKNENREKRSVSALMAPLKELRVWRFGLYYIFAFGGFIAISQWLVIYYVSAYELSLEEAGLLAAIFSIPCSFIRVPAGWLVDRIGARKIMMLVFSISVILCLGLSIPRMEIFSPGKGVISMSGGKVTLVKKEEILVEGKSGKKLYYPLRKKPEVITLFSKGSGEYLLPKFQQWQEARVAQGQVVEKKALLARGYTHIFFSANIWIFTSLVFLLGLAMGVGLVGVYKYIPQYYPKDFSAVGGLVGAIGGLGGFLFPPIFGYLLEWTGLWTSCWFFLAIIVMLCHFWLESTIKKV
jgi:MFS transporter, NNP family, nitrate/nitrite transporter